MIHTIDLFEPLDARLVDLLRSLSRDEWARPTIAGAWTVRDVVAHLLDTPLRRLSFVRDGYPPSGVEIRDDADLVRLVNGMNADGVRTFGRLSPALLVDLLQLTTPQLVAHLRSIPPDAPAAFAVSWAGESSSSHWFDVAREYTERWHHQAQIRLAVDRLAPIMTPSLYSPVLATFVRAMPHGLRDVDAAPGTAIAFTIEGEAGGTWHVRRADEDWRFDDEPAAAPSAHVIVPADVAWRLFTKGLSADAIAASCRSTGDAKLAAAVLATRAIVG